MRRLLTLLLVLGALLLLGVSTALGADDPGTSMDLAMTPTRDTLADSPSKSTTQRLVADSEILETNVREPVLPATRVLIGR